MASVSATMMTNRLPLSPPASPDAVVLKPKNLKPILNKEKVCKTIAGISTAAWMVVPEVAQAATAVDGSLTPSLQNFLLSIGAGGVVLGLIAGVVIGVSNFDPVKRT